MKKLIIILSALVCALSLTSCRNQDIIGGTVNDAPYFNMNTFEWLAAQEETQVVAELFEKAGLKEYLSTEECTVIAPQKWSVRRYVRRRNSSNYPDSLRPVPGQPFTIEQIEDTNVTKMAMYVFPGKFDIETIKAAQEVTPEGLHMTALDGKHEALLSVDLMNTDPGSVWNGENAAGAGFQYSNFLQSKPEIVHVQYKRGEVWELTALERANVGYDTGTSGECDQRYRMYMSDIHTTNGVVHVLYHGDDSYNELYYYHTLFFFGRKSDDVTYKY